MSAPFDLRHGDCLEVMRGMADNSVDSIVTDPPYELGFMGKAWDASGIANNPAMWAECLRVLKPGGHLLAFSGSRTYHRMTCAIEDAGFEVRDQIMWIYGSGFPKSHNLTGEHEGWGTALKPAHEPICVARKPLMGTVAVNMQVHRTGALNINGCRVEWPDGVAPEVGTPGWGGPAKKLTAVPGQDGETVERTKPSQLGRWPANLIHDGSEEVLAQFPDAPGQMADISTTAPSAKTSGIYGPMKREGEASQESRYTAVGGTDFAMKPGARRLDKGSAARFFYCAKASRTDRNEGLSTSSTPVVAKDATMRHCEKADWSTRNGNHHPTVKPTDLMRYLCRLVTPAGGLVLDPFMGSGSTGKAAMLEGFRFVGIDMMPEYVEIARARIQRAIPAPAPAEPVTPQLDLFGVAA